MDLGWVDICLLRKKKKKDHEKKKEINNYKKWMKNYCLNKIECIIDNLM